jgi:hypothetical protein
VRKSVEKYKKIKFENLHLTPFIFKDDVTSLLLKKQESKY